MTAAGYTNDDSGEPGASHAGSQGDFNVVGGGGSGTVYVEDEEDLADMAHARRASCPASSSSRPREPVPGLSTVAYDQIGLDHANNGDITVFVEPHWHDGDGGNVLPGNHGHPPTQQLRAARRRRVTRRCATPPRASPARRSTTPA